MKVKIVGVVPQKYELEGGYKFEGNKVHCIDLETRSEGQTGDQVMDFKIPIDSPLYTVPLKIGCDYNLYFDKKKRVDYLALIDNSTMAIVDM